MADFRRWPKTIELQLECVIGRLHIDVFIIIIVIGVRKIQVLIGKKAWKEGMDTMFLAEPHELQPYDWQRDIRKWPNGKVMVYKNRKLIISRPTKYQHREPKFTSESLKICF